MGSKLGRPCASDTTQRNYLRTDLREQAVQVAVAKDGESQSAIAGSHGRDPRGRCLVVSL